MILDLHPDIRIQKLMIGAEQAPLLVIDDFVADADKLVRRAASRQFTQHAPVSHSSPAETTPSPHVAPSMVAASESSTGIVSRFCSLMISAN